MSKAEKFIQEHTRNCSNLLYICKDTANGKDFNIYNEWLTPDDARKAVEIARKEILLEVAEWIKDTFIFSKGAKRDFCQTFNIKLL